MVFIIGNVRPFHPSEVKHVASFEDMKDVTNGDIVETFGHVLEWDHNCVPVELCESWRLMGDPACDSALREVFSSPGESVGKDLLQAVRSHAAATSHEEAPATHAFLDEVLRRPPPGLAATEEEVGLARQLFIDDSVQIVQALLYFSLAGGLASSRIARTLEAVSYLVPHLKNVGGEFPPSLAEMASQIPKEMNDRTFMRLVETMQFVLDVMGCSVSAPQSPSAGLLSTLLPEGEGWRSAVRVRLLHGVVRWRVQARREREHPMEVLDRDSVPLSQEEVAATLGAFSTIPIWCLHRLHLPPPPDKASAYLALWRHVGYYMGVAPSILHHHFASTRAADKTPPPPSRPHPLPLPFPPPPPPPPPPVRLRMHALLLAQRLPHYFAAWYPRRAWLAKRRAVLAEGMVRSVRWSMGMRRSAFRPRTECRVPLPQAPTQTQIQTQTQTQMQTYASKETQEGGELAQGVAEAEAVMRDPARAQALTRQWGEVLFELVGVSVGVGVLASVAAYWGAKSAMAIASGFQY
ncbi:hypothetical protein GSI_11007 [Ganoderma sinense ZZ0214-1]|uniref:ER-bound oxygenase mpaB/mpaB'/Rubber oxygenase catalytic domain-containing protein n=1 Tax=Ganoderma sinense ZZ0214-1 TaxID=1077348 RepID=A0A2G8S249_9APHY|nr:hypothetical protein GSI_11007 [Ganoderma sinense ZZ0214-1]